MVNGNIYYDINGKLIWGSEKFSSPSTQPKAEDDEAFVRSGASDFRWKVSEFSLTTFVITF